VSHFDVQVLCHAFESAWRHLLPVTPSVPGRLNPTRAIPPRTGEVTWKCLPAAPMFHSRKDNGRLFHDQIIPYGFDPLDAPCDLTRFIDGLLRINEAAQLNDALVSFDTDLE